MKRLALWAAIAAACAAQAFDPPVDSAGGVTVRLSNPGTIEKLDAPVPITVTVNNRADASAEGTVRLKGTDGWTAEPEQQAFEVAPGKKIRLKFTVTPSAKSYPAHYPIHAYATFRVGGKEYTAHPILVVAVSGKCGYHEPWADPPQEPVHLAAPGAVRLEDVRQCRVGLQVHDEAPQLWPPGKLRGDQATGAYVQRRDRIDRGELKSGLSMHEPWRTGWGVIWVDYPIVLPDAPCKLVFWTAVRDTHPPKEPPGDGVDFRVYVAQAGSADFKQVFRRFSDAKRWQKAEVNLSDYRGQEITLRLWQGPGPDNDTSCDQAFWGEPTVVAGGVKVGFEPHPSGDARKQAVQLARKALGGDGGPRTWRLECRGETIGAAVVPGELGIIDAAIAFATEKAALVFDGFRLFVDGSQLGSWRSSVAVRDVATSWEDGRLTLTYDLAAGDKTFSARVRVWADRCGLRFAFDMPDVQRSRDRSPRFTEISLGRVSEPVRRLYCGFGNVMVPNGRVGIPASGFRLNTRHIGADFPCGLSIVQASDVFPDRLQWRPAEQRWSMVVHDDATVTLVASSKGAFAAARAYRDIAGYKPSPGHEKIVGRMCLDTWGGVYAHDAARLRRAAAYGLTDSIFIKHVWQRWGYDYRLPDIYPPSERYGSFDDFMRMVRAAKDAGILFALHDNYIDFYPDASGFSYRYIVFNADGQPQRAWFQKARKAQSYRWLPGAFMPWLERNLKLIRDGIGPTAYFVDVFSAMPPIEYHDQQGRLYTRRDCARAWAAAIDRIREMLGDEAPVVSEAGHDALVGHLDAGEADHYSADRWSGHLADHERVPWHDMVTHGAFVLLGGGLGHRYSGGKPGHGYGSDDYLSNTVIGGRNPMCKGPCSHETVVTYWLLHDVCARLARASLESVEFVGGNIHRLHSTFSDGSEVWVNRDGKPWKVQGLTLPQYGFVARAGDCGAEIALRSGIPARMSASPGVLFVDARPPTLDRSGRVDIITYTTGGRIEGNKVIVDVVWDVHEPMPEGEAVFVHICHPAATQPERIGSYGRCDLPPAKLRQPGRYKAHITWEVPEDARPGVWSIRYGLWNKRLGGRRALPIGVSEDSRIVAGDVVVRRRQGRAVPVEYRPGPGRAGAIAANPEAKVVDFGPVATNATFQLNYDGDQWLLTPAPGLMKWKATLRLDRLGAAGRKVAEVVPLDMTGQRVDENVEVKQHGDQLEILVAESKAFRYRIVFAGAQ